MRQWTDDSDRYCQVNWLKMKCDYSSCIIRRCTPPTLWTAKDSTGNVATCQQTITVKDTQKPTLTLAITRLWSGEDDDKAFRITSSASDNCPGVRISAVISIGCRRIPISSGQVVSIECGEDECRSKPDQNGRLKIEAATGYCQLNSRRNKNRDSDKMNRPSVIWSINNPLDADRLFPYGEPRSHHCSVSASSVQMSSHSEV